MIQGLKTAPATFHRIIDHSFKPLLWTCLLAYFDDLTVHSRSFADHISHLRQTFQIMRQVGFKAKPSKCKLGMKSLEWLGYVISNGEIRPDNKLTDAIKKLKVPTSTAEVRHITGLFNFYRAWIPNFATRCAPLDEVKQKYTQFVWNDAQQHAFED